jgi:DNA-directed RNA polymerase sigma subunit (sigma70/sigma32)
MDHGVELISAHLEVVDAFGVTRGRIRQIENNTLRKLQRLSEAQRLRGLQ